MPRLVFCVTVSRQQGSQGNRVKNTIRLSFLMAVLVGALALPAAANGQLSTTPTSLSFSQPVGTTSASQSTRLTLMCGGCFPVAVFTPVVAVTPAAFTQTNDCSDSLFVTAFGIPEDTCTINVAFAANAAGTVNGTLTTGMGGPTTSLSGTGVAQPATPTPAAAPRCKKGKKKPNGAAAAKKKCGKKKRK